MTLFGKKGILADVIKDPGLGQVLNPMTSTIREKEPHRVRRGRQKSERVLCLQTKENQELPRISGSHQKLGERHRVNSPSELPEACNPANSLI